MFNVCTGMLAIPAADVKHFLESILSTGLHAVVTKQGNSMRHEWGQTPDELVSLASTKTDCWFSPAAFSGMSRKAKDCVGAAALWLDIDIGAQHAKPDYPDAKSFAADFKNFMAGTGLPVPWIVSTGHGVHLYWPLGVTVQPDKWSRLMARLFAACNKFGLKYDHAATDISRILRVPGTYNYKDTPVPVVILRQGETDLRTLVTVLKQYEPVKQTAVRQEDSTRELRETAPVVNGCEQIRTCGPPAVSRSARTGSRHSISCPRAMTATLRTSAVRLGTRWTRTSILLSCALRSRRHTLRSAPAVPRMAG